MKALLLLSLLSVFVFRIPNLRNDVFSSQETNYFKAAVLASTNVLSTSTPELKKGALPDFTALKPETPGKIFNPQSYFAASTHHSFRRFVALISYSLEPRAPPRLPLI